ncbi:Alpha/Beta hydrolase protein [Mycena floridula]|nr:Alpha/Beta hydrolase protein [Mycena floridula]
MPFSSHTYTVSDGIEIFFTDSRPPPGSDDYTTLVILHGAVFNGYGFEQLHDLAHAQNLRTVICNRRGYSGSTSYTEAEIDDLKNGRQSVADRWQEQLGKFLLQFLEKEKIPKISADRKTGGYCVLGWSIGTVTACSLFQSKSPEFEPLEAYVKDLILYEPPYLSFGYDAPDSTKGNNMLADPTAMIPANFYKLFTQNAGWYYNHSRNPTTIQDLDLKGTKESTTANWTSEEMAKYTDENATLSEMFMFGPAMQRTIKTLANHVLFDQDLAQSYFPQVHISYIVCTRASWRSAWGNIETKRLYNEHINRGEKIRKMSFLAVEGANHFAHQDKPNELMEKIVESIRG